VNGSRRWDTNERVRGGILSRLTLNVGIEGPAEALNKHEALINMYRKLYCPTVE